jgi:hypothetical protein
MRKERVEMIANLQESQKLFIDRIKQEGGISLREAMSFEDINKGIWFGPDTDALDLLDRYVWLGIMRFDRKQSRFVLK